MASGPLDHHGRSARTRPTLILHVGPHKTATTALQHCLFDAEDDLRSQGVHLAETGRLDAGHHLLAATLREHRGAANVLTAGATLPAWSDVIDEYHSLRAGDRLLVTSENLSLARPLPLRRLADHFAGVDVELVAGWRCPAEHIPSIWQESVKWREHRSLASAERSLRRHPAVRMSPMLRRWRHATGAQRTHAIVIPRGRTLAPAERMAAVLGCDPTTLARRWVDQPANMSLSWVHAEAMRAVRLTLPAGRQPAVAVQRQRVMLPLAAIVPEGADPRPPRLSASRSPACQRDTTRVSAELRRIGADVHGDPTELFPVADSWDQRGAPTQGEVRAALMSMADQERRAGGPLVGNIEEALARFDTSVRALNRPPTS